MPQWKQLYWKKWDLEVDVWQRERGREKHLLGLLHGEFMSIYEKLFTLCSDDFIPNLFYLLMLFFAFCSFLSVCNIMKKRMTLNPVFFFVDFMYIMFVFWNCLKLFSALFWFFGFMRPAYKMVDISYKLISIFSQVLLCYVFLSFETLNEALFCIFFSDYGFYKIAVCYASLCLYLNFIASLKGIWGSGIGFLFCWFSSQALVRWGFWNYVLVPLKIKIVLFLLHMGLCFCRYWACS